ncbi:uncharacterized protein LOC106459907 isoform X2 [Limulus polyphemus]|uniref:Phosphodiesterase n=1 Tax=Limulus polyphemus TaxID=6850 RepID=A0ABM1SEY5_LIMPO|nr:uncharacterized protein LOC106459907 isoform X2 [Limulus polyphemus]
MIPYATCVCFGSRRRGPGRTPLLTSTDQEETNVSVERKKCGTLCIQVSGRESKDKELKLEERRKSLKHSQSELRLLESLSLNAKKPNLFGTFKTLQLPRRRHPILIPDIHHQPGIDDFFNGIVQGILASCQKWAFNTFTLDMATGGHSLSILLLHLFHQYGLIKEFHLDVLKVCKCFNLIELGYHGDNPYHNSVHAADVAQAMHCFLQENTIVQQLSPLEIMASLLGAVCHDIDHPGVSQPFLIATSNHLAALYKNFSVLENHHWRSAISCLRETELLSHLSREVRDDVECQIRSLILATDITRQQEFLSRFKKYIAENALDLSKKEIRHFILQIGLKCADLCNPCRPWDISQQWSYQVCKEFYRQGDIERELSLPVTPMCDRTRTSVARIQVDFFRYVVSPLFEIWDQFLNTSLSNHLMKNLRDNQAEWEEGIERELADKEETSTTIGAAAMAMEEYAPLASDEEDFVDECGSFLGESFFFDEAFGPFHRRRYSMPVENQQVLLKGRNRQFSAPQVLQYRRRSSVGPSLSISSRIPSPNLYTPFKKPSVSRLLQTRTSILSLSTGVDSLFLQRLQHLADDSKELKPELTLECSLHSHTLESAHLETEPSENVKDVDRTTDIEPEILEYRTSGSRTSGVIVHNQMFYRRTNSPLTNIASDTLNADAYDKFQGDVGAQIDEMGDSVLDCSNECCTVSPRCYSEGTENAQRTESFRQSTSHSIPEQQDSSERTGALSVILIKDKSLAQSESTINKYIDNGSTHDSSATLLADETCDVNFFLGEENPEKELCEPGKQTSWRTHITRSLSDERPDSPSKGCDSPVPSVGGSTKSSTSSSSRLVCRRGSAPTSSVQKFSDSYGKMKDHSVSSVFSRRWSVPAEPLSGVRDSVASEFRNSQDENVRLQKELVRHHSFGLLETLCVVPSSESEYEGSSTGPTSTGTTCSTRRNSSIPPGVVRHSFSSRGTFDTDSNDPEGSYSSENQDTFLPCIPPSRPQLARRRGSLPADVPLSLMGRVPTSVETLCPGPGFGLDPLQYLDSKSSSTVCRRDSMGEILQALLRPTSSRLTFHGLGAGSSRLQNTISQGILINPEHTTTPGLPRRGSAGLDLFSGFWRSINIDKTQASHTTKQRVNLPQQSCPLGSSGDSEWSPQYSATDTSSHKMHRINSFSVTTTELVSPPGIPNTVRCQRRRGSVPVNVPLLSFSSGETSSGD